MGYGWFFNALAFQKSVLHYDLIPLYQELEHHKAAVLIHSH